MSWTKYVSNRLDQFFLSQRKRDALEGSLSMVTGLLLLGFSIQNLFTGEYGSRIMWALFLFLSAGLVAVGVRDIWIYKRGLSEIPKEPGRVPGDLSIFRPATVARREELPAAAARPTDEMATRRQQALALDSSLESVTEQTTRHLDLGAEHPAEKS